MLSWFIPAGALALVLRSGFLSARAVRALFRGMVWNAAAIAVFGLVQYLSGTRSIYWIEPHIMHFFATFGYASHAGAFFLLMFSLGCGLMLDDVFGRGRGRPVPRVRVASLALASLLCLAGSSLSLALAPLILVWALAGLFTAYALVLAWQRLGGLQRLHLILGVALVVGVGYVLMAMIYHESAARIHSELWELREPHVLARKIGERVFLYRPALRIFLDHPWFGVGGWGFRYFLGIYVKASDWVRLDGGYANVHNDLLQFLAEFGLAGTGMIAVAFMALLVTLVRSRVWRNPLAVPPLLGAFVVSCYSMMDLPFRCPAILYAWTALLAGLPAVVVSMAREEKNQL
jgi:O-antigen ligase